MPNAPRTYDLDDLTLILGVRLSEVTPWVLERLGLLRRVYRSLPRVIVVDQGSQPAHAEQVEAVCKREGFSYVGDTDYGPYSPARAKNLGALRADTELIVFADVDFFGETALFERLVDAANQLRFSEYLDQLLTLPIYHLSQSATDRVLSAPSIGAELGRTLAASVYSERGKQVLFVAPYSNCFLCRRDFYLMVGGQNERFRRHGSEDFEFLLRVAVFTGQHPLPAHPQENSYGPTQHGFFEPRPYRGFRRLFELMGQQAELLGLRIAHLEHPRPQPGQSWYRDHQDKRAAFENETGPYLRDPASLLQYDFLPRKVVALVDPRSALEADLVTPLRAAGYRLCKSGDPLAKEAEAVVVVGAGEPPPGSAGTGARHTLRFVPASQPGEYVLQGLPGTDALVVRGEPRDAGRSGVTRFLVTSWGDQRWQRVALDDAFSALSYASARLGLGRELARFGSERALSHFERRLKKFVSSPRLFFQDSRFPWVRELERLSRRRAE